MLHASTVLFIGICLLSFFHAIATFLLWRRGRNRIVGLEARIMALENQSIEPDEPAEPWRSKVL